MGSTCISVASKTADVPCVRLVAFLAHLVRLLLLLLLLLLFRLRSAIDNEKRHQRPVTTNQTRLRALSSLPCLSHPSAVFQKRPPPKTSHRRASTDDERLTGRRSRRTDAPDAETSALAFHPRQLEQLECSFSLPLAGVSWRFLRPPSGRSNKSGGMQVA